MSIDNGDYLLFANNAVLGAVFIPTLLKRGAHVHLLTAAIYAVMIFVGAVGYFINGQYLPAIPTAIGSLMWFLMLMKSWWRKEE